jgi:flagellar hook-length control protein FliK
MLNLKLEVDLKLSQAEKARFNSEKEQADKNAFYSELEQAEKAWSDSDKRKLDTGSQKQPEQQIGGNLHKKSHLSDDKQVENESDKRKPELKNKEAEHQMGGNLHKQSQLSDDRKEKSDFTKGKLELSNNEAEQDIGGNLHKKSQLPDDKQEKSDFNKGKLEQINKEAEQHIGGNLHKPLPSESDIETDSASENKVEGLQSDGLEQHIDGNLENKKFITDFSSVEIDSTNIKYQPDTEQYSKSVLNSDYEKPEQEIGGNLHTPAKSDADEIIQNDGLVNDVDKASRLKEQFIGGNLDKDRAAFSEFRNDLVKKQAEQPTPKSVSDTLLAQIEASNSQKTEVKQHLAPVSKALKDVLSQYLNSEEQVTVKSDKKIDTIVPPNLDVDALEGFTSPVVNQGSEVTKVGKPIDQNWPIIGDEKTSSKSITISTTDSEVELKAMQGLGSQQLSSSEMGKGNSDLLTVLSAQANESKIINPNSAAQANGVESAQKRSKSSLENESSAEAKLSVKAETNITDSVSLDDKQIKKESTTLDVSKLSNLPQKEFVLPTKESVVISPEAKLSESLERAPKLDDAMTAGKVKPEPLDARLKQQIKTLPPQDKVALQQSLQQAVDSGKFNDVQLKRAQDTLALLVQDSEQQPDKIQPNVLDKPVKNMAGEPVSAKVNADVSSYNSTKVTTESLSEVAKGTVEQLKAASANNGDNPETIQVQKDLREPNLERKAVLSPQVENIFKAVTAQTQGITPQSNHELDISQTVQQFETVMQNAQTQQSASASQKMSVDPNLAQALNLQKADVVKALHEKVNAMLTINNKEAEIRLDPPELGSMQIRIRNEAEQAQINFVVQNQQAKEALEQSMPKLKEMLAEQGIQLGESNIQQDSGSSSGQGTDDTQESSHSKLANQEPQAQNSQQTRTNSIGSESGIDYYA